MTQTSVLITGAAKRLGKATALAFAHRGCQIALHYNHSVSDAQLLQQQINQIKGASCFLLSGDLSDSETSNALINQCVEEFGGLDHLVNNASIFYPAPIEELTDEQLNETININYQSPRQIALLAQTYLSQKQGSIVNLLDIYAQAGHAEHSAYVASKAALNALTQAQAKAFAPNVRVNGVAPGAILWPSEKDKQLDITSQKTILQRSALKRLGSADDIAKAVTFLALDAPYITGNVIRVDGGRRDFI